MSYCKNCAYRTEKWRNKRSKLEPIEHLFVESANDFIDFTTNQKGFCILGYTQNPSDLEATQNAIRNGAEICPVNPFRNKV